MIKQQLEKNNQEKIEIRLAETLGLCLADMKKLDYEIHETKDGLVFGLVYNKYIKFNKDVAPEVLKRIKGMGTDFIVYF